MSGPPYTLSRGGVPHGALRSLRVGTNSIVEPMTLSRSVVSDSIIHNCICEHEPLLDTHVVTKSYVDNACKTTEISPRLALPPGTWNLVEGEGVADFIVWATGSSINHYRVSLSGKDGIVTATVNPASDNDPVTHFYTYRRGPGKVGLAVKVVLPTVVYLEFITRSKDMKQTGGPLTGETIAILL